MLSEVPIKKILMLKLYTNNIIWIDFIFSTISNIICIHTIHILNTDWRILNANKTQQQKDRRMAGRIPESTFFNFRNTNLIHYLTRSKAKESIYPISFQSLNALFLINV